MIQRARVGLVLACLVAGSSCNDLERFATGQGESYCGAITLAGSFRTGMSPRVQMRLEIDPAELDGAGSPGTLSTFEAADGVRPERRLLDRVELRRIPAVENDPLSRLEFGDGRIRNMLFAVSPNEPAPDGGAPPAPAESILVVLSFRTDDTIEVRLLRPGAPRDGDEPVPEGRRALFGIFSLRRLAGKCGF